VLVLAERIQVELGRNWALQELQAGLCKALAHPTRLAIIEHLKDGSCSVTELVHRLGLRQANLSQHLGVLRDAGIVVAKRSGANVLYSIADRRIIVACALVREFLEGRVSRQSELFQWK
jgi:ArsR family transcriptional regulator